MTCTGKSPTRQACMASVDYKEVGHRLCKYFAENDLKDIQLARRMVRPKLSLRYLQNQIRKLKRGERCSSTFLDALPEALGYHQQFLLYGSTEPNWEGLIDRLKTGTVPVSAMFELPIPVVSWLLNSRIGTNDRDTKRNTAKILAVVRRTILRSYGVHSAARFRRLSEAWLIKDTFALLELTKIHGVDVTEVKQGESDQGDRQLRSGSFRITRLRGHSFFPAQPPTNQDGTSCRKARLSAVAAQRKERRIRRRATIR